MLRSVSVNDLSLNDAVQMTLYGAVEGVTQLNGKVLARLSYDGLPPGNNAFTHHTNIYPRLSETQKLIYPDDYKKYNYVMVLGVDNQVYYIGEPWIVENALYVNSVAQATITLHNFRDPDTTALRTLLLQAGYDIDAIVVRA